MSTTVIEFETPRLRLRQWTDADLEPFAAMNADPRVMEFFANRPDSAASDAMVRRIQAAFAERGWGLWAIQALNTGEFIGFAGLNRVPADLPVSPGVEVGWRLAPAHWGQGYATEAGAACLQVGFQRLGFAEIVSFTAVGNHKSRAVMARLGLQQDAATFGLPSVAAGHALREQVVYRLSAAAWQARPR